MILSSKELSNLTNLILSGQSAVKSFEAISASFLKAFAKSEHFKIGKTMVALLKNGFLTDSVPRIICLFLLWDMYKLDSLENNPFLAFILSNMKGDNSPDQFTLPIPTKVFMHTIMRYSDRARDLCKTTPLQLISMDADVSALRSCDWSAFEVQLQEHLQQIPKIDCCGIPCVLPDEDCLRSTASLSDPNGISPPIQRKQNLEALLGSELFPESMKSLRPEFLRLAPPLMPCPQAANSVVPEDSPFASVKDWMPDNEWAEELIWLNPNTVDHQFHWDSTMGNSSPTFELRQLMSVALSSGLTMAQQQSLIQAIKEEIGLIHSFGLTPENFPNLVNRNLNVAIEVILGLISTQDVNPFLNALLTMDMTVHSVEVVNRVAAVGVLPPEFIHTYISTVISTCQGTQDKFIQMRHVRLVCVLIQSLIRNRIIDVHDAGILYEVQAFCLEFNKTREATTLYRLIKSIESSTTACQGASSASCDIQLPSQSKES